MEHHVDAVKQIQKRVKLLHDQNVPFRIYHGSTNSTRHKHQDPERTVDTSSLHHVITVDKSAKTAIVEPNVPMDLLVDECMRYGLLPPVVPEFPGITVGGSFCGTAGESSSFKYGFFDRTVNWIDIILADGELVRCSPTERADLFYGSVGAFGSTGVTVLFEIQLIDSGGFVDVSYVPVFSFQEAVTTLREVVRKPLDFVDGILFSKQSGVIVTATISDMPSHTVKRFTRAGDPWWYLHVKKKFKQASTREERHDAAAIAEHARNISADSVPIWDYLFRYDRGAFWMGRHGFHVFHAPFDALTRRIVDPLMHTRKLYQALHASGHASRFILQDLIMPESKVQKLLEYLEQETAIYPLWLCPIKGESKSNFHNPSSTTGVPSMFINVGCWGPGRRGYSAKRNPYASAGSVKARSRFVSDNRALEAEVRRLEGHKWLYAQTFYSEDEFWQQYDQQAYDALRKRWRAESLPSIYDKVKTVSEPANSQGPTVNAWRGVITALRVRSGHRPKRQ